MFNSDSIDYSFSWSSTLPVSSINITFNHTLFAAIAVVVIATIATSIGYTSVRTMVNCIGFTAAAICFVSYNKAIMFIENHLKPNYSSSFQSPLSWCLC